MKCRVCGCTEERPCDPPCEWYSAGLCSTCARAVAALLFWSEEANRPSIAALTREYRAAKDAPFHKLSAAARGVR
jgi:hypothetical protein